MTFALILVSACSSEEKGPLILIEQDWDGQVVTTAVARILLEEELGLVVDQKFAPADSAAMFAGLESGDYHFACCNWPSFSKGFLDDFVGDRSTVQRIGSTGILGTSGWFVPRYMVEGDSSRNIVPTTPNLQSYQDLNEYSDVFATADTGGKGRLLDFTPGWDYKNQERLDALGVDYQVTFSGSEAASFAELDATYQRGGPILTVMWAPHWAFAKYDLLEIDLPDHTTDCYPGGTEFACGFPYDDVAKLAWPGLKDEFPKAYHFLNNFTITNEQQNEMVLAMTDGGKTSEDAARDWVNANKSVWSPWIP
ncbi:MAG: glycine betaine ABC transporter substrate-binding protein [Chloroflexota bacterium]|nr:glycine betaine ABC transporter substrate-binding protein [Chloroflexota bacterium]